MSAVSDILVIASFFREHTGLEPQLVSDVRRGARRRERRLLVWSVMTEQGHFYVVEGKRREVMRAAGSRRVEEVCRRYLELHPEETTQTAAR